MFRLQVVLVSLALALMGLGCAGANSPASAPVSTGGLAGASHAGAGSHVASWGFYNVSINARDWTADITPLRNAEYTIDAVRFLQPPHGKTANLKITVCDATRYQSEGILGVGVTLIHPFPGLDQFTGFDVMGAIMSPGLLTGLYDSKVSFTDGVQGCKLLNADGYT